MLISKPIPRANLCTKTMLLYIEVGNLYDWGLRISIFLYHPHCYYSLKQILPIQKHFWRKQKISLKKIKRETTYHNATTTISLALNIRQLWTGLVALAGDSQA